MKKQVPALIASVIITLVIGLGMVVVGASAAFNKNGVPVRDSPYSASSAQPGAAGSTQNTAGSAAQEVTSDQPGAAGSAQAQIQQLQALVAQYQQHEQQYQQREQQLIQQQQQLQDQVNADQQQLGQANQQMEQVQRLLEFLQRRGIIQVDQDGRIFVPGD